MSDEPMLPRQCKTMEQVRVGVDATDRVILALLKRRFAYMRAAARIKRERSAVRDEGRKAEVVKAMKEAAAEEGLPAEDIARLWDQLVEASIAFELEEWDRLKG